ncbi:MAG: beta-glucosidase [Promethearchaeota archaeon]
MNDTPLYLNPNANIEERVEDLLSRLTLDEKLLLVRGHGFWTTNAINRLHIPEFGMTDGPLGVAHHSGHDGKRTRFPASIGLAATWNKTLAYEMGKAMGKETKLAGRHQLLGPGVNIIRSPFCGRNFEYLSEDPVLSSDIGAEIVKGIQSQKTAACLKHYITNNSETERRKIDTVVDERSFYEIYVKNFKRIIEKSDPWGLMCCFNKVFGVYGAENKLILRDILRDKLGFTGHVVTDWGATTWTSGPMSCVKAGLNLEMPGKLSGRGRIANLYFKNKYTLKKLHRALSEGEITEDDIDYIVKPLLRTIIRVKLLDEETPHPQKILDIPEHQQLAQQIAEESIVLLRNENQTLPLNLDSISKVAILGPNAKKVFGKRLHGGSSAAVPPFFITPFEGIANYIQNKAEIVENPEDADVVFLVVGLDNGGGVFSMFFSKKEADTEGRDRTRYPLPKEQEFLIHETVVKNPNTVVILIVGSPIDLSSWFTKVPAVLNAWYPGMMGGTAIARCLFGDVNPSGKLPVTYPLKITDHPAHTSERSFPGDLKALKIHFDEGIYVGYRHFDKQNIKPFFPFGFGLSYTNFEISNLKLDKAIVKSSDSYTISVDIKNVGTKPGAEIVQVYISDDECSVDRPPRELQAFEKVHLNPGESKTVSITLDQSSFQFYSTIKHDFVAEPGAFTIWIGNSSRNLPLHTNIEYQI